MERMSTLNNGTKTFLFEKSGVNVIEISHNSLAWQWLNFSLCLAPNECFSDLGACLARTLAPIAFFPALRTLCMFSRA